MLAARKGDPCGRSAALCLDFGCPIIVVRGFQRVHNARKPRNVFLRRRRVAAARGADSARKQRHCLGIGKFACGWIGSAAASRH